MELEADSYESNQDGIMSAFILTVKSTRKGVDLIDEEEELLESNFEMMDD